MPAYSSLIFGARNTCETVPRRSRSDTGRHSSATLLLVVDPDALYDALKNGAIAGAALDVTDPEPISGDHKLLSLPNCLVVPHIASASVATRRKMTDMAAANLFAGISGERLPSCVNPQVYEKP